MKEVIQNSQDALNLKEISDPIEFIHNLPASQTVVVDFDETLFLRNSTEEYLDSLQPQLLGNLVLTVLEKLNLWKLLPPPLRSHESIDWLRVVIATCLFPWTILLWKNRAQKLARDYFNQPLLNSLQQSRHARIIVATRGFEFIVRPLLASTPLKVERLIGCRFLHGGGDRQLGKEEMLSRWLAPAEIQDSALITDSLDDASLLEIVKYPFLVRWPNAQYIRAMSGAYLPFFYIEKVKKPGTRFLINVVLKDHIIALLFACTWLSSMPVFHGLGIALLAFSWWCIYEIGYFQNDLVAEKYEKKPVLSDTYQRYKDRMDVFMPWVVSLGFAIPGLALVALGNTLTWTTVFDGQAYTSALRWGAIVPSLSLWIASLVGTRLTFTVYNYLDESTRIWLYPLLQFAKYAGFLLIANINSVGLALLIAQVFVDWIPYMIYRCGGDRDRLKEQFFKVFVFLLLTVSTAIVQRDGSHLLTVQFFAILLWYGGRSLSQVKEIVRNAHFIWH
ncbi:MAG: HAD family hydrolase [Leptolyngbyaceae cyanobacterium]